jgi:hypothetical protein
VAIEGIVAFSCGGASVILDHDDVNLTVNAIHCVNNESSKTMRCTLNGTTREILPAASLDISIPTGQRPSITPISDPRGNVKWADPEWSVTLGA